MFELKFISKTNCVAMFALLLYSICAATGNDESLTPKQKQQIDSLFKSWDRDGSPGAAIGVMKKGKLVYSKGFGFANLEHDVPIDASTVFYMASVSKHFVTFCILLLEEQGKLSLDDEIQKHLPDFPRYDDPLTIRNFIHHTSGVRDYLELWRLKGNNYLDHIDENEVYELIKRQKKLNFKPGERYLYSNSCYFMLAMIVKKASGLSIRDFAKKQMFEPLGMKDTQFHDDVNRMIRRRASSYVQTGSGIANQISRFDLVGSGGLYSTIEDMALWDRNFYSNKLGKGDQNLIRKLQTNGLLANGKSAGYAFGLQNGSFRGLKTVEHGGALGGYRTHFLRIPEKELTFVVLANVNTVSPSTRVREMASILLNDVTEPAKKKEPGRKNDTSKAKASPKAKPKFMSLPEKELSKFTGVYVRPDGSELTIAIREKELHVTQGWNNIQYGIKAIGPSNFVLPNRPVKFHFANFANGKAQRLNVDVSGRKEVTERKRKSKPVNLDDYVGTYFSEELDVHYELFQRDGKLVYRYQHRYLEPLSLIPTRKDQFRVSFGANFKFERTKERVTGFRIDAGRVQGLWFERTR